MIGNTNGMTRREYEDLSKLARRQEKVAKTRAKQHAAELVADFEAQLAQKFEADDERWRLVREQLSEMTRRANAEVHRICYEAGVRPELAPGFQLSWYNRGENASKDRRGELRAAAATRIDAMRKRAEADIEERTVDFETELLTGTLETGRARELLEAMPKAALSLMQPLDPAELDRTLPMIDRYGRAITALPDGLGDDDD